MIIQTERKPVANFFNNYAIAPKLYTTTGNALSDSESIHMVAALFESRIETRNAILKMQYQGLRASQIVSISKHYQEHEDSMNWEYIATDNNLLKDLIGLGIDIHDTFCFESAVNQGQFLVVAIITDHTPSQAQHLLANIGQSSSHKILSVC